MTIENNNQLIDKIVCFINSIGIPCKKATLSTDTFLPGMAISHGSLLYDPSLVKYPCDLLHEAGHMAVLLPADRLVVNSPDNLNGDLQEGGAEMGAIAWSWAALKELELDPALLFHENGYKGDAASLIDQFNNGNYIAVELLQWMGMTIAPKADIPPNDYTYPKMKNWLRFNPETTN